MSGWEAGFERLFQQQGYRLHLRRPHGDRMEVMKGDLITEIHPPYVEVADAGIYLPGDMYDAIVEAIDPPAHKAEVKRLEEALAVERRRVDDMLLSFHGIPPLREAQS